MKGDDRDCVCESRRSTRGTGKTEVKRVDGASNRRPRVTARGVPSECARRQACPEQGSGEEKEGMGEGGRWLVAFQTARVKISGSIRDREGGGSADGIRQAVNPTRRGGTTENRKRINDGWKAPGRDSPPGFRK